MADPLSAAPLAPWTVVLTRPAHMARESAAALERAGAKVIAFPVLDIAPRPVRLDPALATSARGVIFVSANAVAFGLPILRNAGLGLDSACFAVGDATANALRLAGQTRVHVPEGGFDSEHLLALPALQQVKGDVLLIVKGSGASDGRTLIAETLAARGATIEVLNCYERRAAEVNDSLRVQVIELLGKAEAAVFVVASVESLDALEASLAGSVVRLRSAMLAVPHERIAAVARDRGYSRVCVVALSAQNLVESLARHICGPQGARKTSLLS